MSAILAAGGTRPDCVFAVNDVMAVGALARLRAEGLAVPGDIAVAGFDDIMTLRDIYPPLTTVVCRSSRWARWPPTWCSPAGDQAAGDPGARRGDPARQHRPPARPSLTGRGHFRVLRAD